MLEQLLTKSINEPPLPIYGQILFTTKGINEFKVPANCTSISAVAIAYGYRSGGGLSYRTTIPVTPNETLTVYVGGLNIDNLDSYIQRNTTTLLIAEGPTNNGYTGGRGGKAASSVNTGGGNGGNYGTGQRNGCGGAGGYSGNGGNGGSRDLNDNILANPTAGQGGAGGGGGIRTINSSNLWGAGGGTWPYGDIGVNGVAGNMGFTTNDSSRRGGRGSYSNGTYKNSSNLYGGGLLNFSQLNACVRIIWGPNRFFPNTNTQDMFD